MLPKSKRRSQCILSPIFEVHKNKFPQKCFVNPHFGGNYSILLPIKSVLLEHQSRPASTCSISCSISCTCPDTAVFQTVSHFPMLRFYPHRFISTSLILVIAQLALMSIYCQADKVSVPLCVTEYYNSFLTPFCLSKRNPLMCTQH